MNILVDNIDDVVSKKIQLEGFRTDFRISILFELLMQDPNIEKEDKVLQALVLFYSDPQTVNQIGLHKAIDNIVWFYRCGKEKVNQENEQDEEDKEETKTTIKNNINSKTKNTKKEDKR